MPVLIADNSFLSWLSLFFRGFFQKRTQGGLRVRAAAAADRSDSWAVPYIGGPLLNNIVFFNVMAIYASLANNNIYASLSFDIEFSPLPPLSFFLQTEHDTNGQRLVFTIKSELL